MNGQYAHLVTMSELPNVTVRVIPAGQRPPHTAAFHLTSTDDAVIAYQETQRSTYYYSEPDAIAHYRALFDELRERAYSPDRSRELIAGLRLWPGTAQS